MKIVLVGYGKMGKTIEQVAISRGHQITGRIDINNHEELDLVQGDVAIEFSHPDAAYDNVRRCIERNLPVVCGTTGWLQRRPEIEALARSRNAAFFYASNYSLGVNIFFRANEILASMLNNFGYDAAIDEIHHKEKKDAPSGTAITLAEGIMKHMTGKKSWVNNPSDNPAELAIQSFRINQVPGTHVVKYSSVMDDIEIKHTAHTREAFALGAVMVAEWIKGRTGVLNMGDFLKF